MDNEKFFAAKKALEFIEEGMTVGLGSGTTANEFIALLGQKCASGFKISGCIPTSYDSEGMAVRAGLSKYLCIPAQISKLDVCVDGADYIGKGFVLKGGGAALTREKVLAYNAEKFIVIAGESKLAIPQPDIAIECIRFSAPFIMRELKKKGFESKIRTGTGKIGPIVSDNGNFIMDAKIPVKKPKDMETELNALPGALENGIFTRIGMVIIGGKDGAKETPVR
jgi:ribose 5-phosphate isomerase A